MLFWKDGGNADTDWADDGEYTNGELIRYSFRKPLQEFTNHDDNPDMPVGWDNFLIYTLAMELAPEVDGIDLDTRRWVGSRANTERIKLFPSKREPDQHKQHVNLTEFF